MRMPVALLAACLIQPALAAEYTQQEQANIQLVQDFYAALDAADANGTMSAVIADIAEKYIALDYKQHASGEKGGRENFIEIFQNLPKPPAGTAKPPVEPAKIVAMMAEGNVVVRISSRGPQMIWNMFRVEGGKLAEHWDARGEPPRPRPQR